MVDKTPTVLTIAGSDGYGGAGIQIDSKTIHALGGYSFSAIAALTSQNSTGVKSIHITPPDVLRSQIKCILDDIEVDAVKIGMIGGASNIQVVIDLLKEYDVQNIILDPIVSSSSGSSFLCQDGLTLMKKELFRVATIVTPNIPEFNIFSNGQDITAFEEIADIDTALDEFGANCILLKGGHSTQVNESTDYLLQCGNDTKAFTAARIDTTHTHGTGCILSSAIATHLALGHTLEYSITQSKKFLHNKLENAALLFSYKEESSCRREAIF